jgi:hypothetical protein
MAESMPAACGAPSYCLDCYRKSRWAEANRRYGPIPCMPASVAALAFPRVSAPHFNILRRRYFALGCSFRNTGPSTALAPSQFDSQPPEGQSPVQVDLTDAAPLVKTDHARAVLAQSGTFRLSRWRLAARSLTLALPGRQSTVILRYRTDHHCPTLVG